jgi:hypothetical protein
MVESAHPLIPLFLSANQSVAYGFFRFSWDSAYYSVQK